MARITSLVGGILLLLPMHHDDDDGSNKQQATKHARHSLGFSVSGEKDTNITSFPSSS